MSDKALEALRVIGSCATWHIKYSSEGCEIAIGGIPVMLSDMAGDGLRTFVKAGPPFELEHCILQAADAFERLCYPERGRRWIEE